MEYIQSPDLKLREIGAMVAGDLKLREAIPHLELLLQDKSQDVDRRTGKTTISGGMGAWRVDPAQAARRALQEIAEDQKRNEMGTFLPPDADDHHGWLQALDRGQQAKDLVPLRSFLEHWRSARQGVRLEVLQRKPDVEQAIYAMFPPFFLPEATQKTAEYFIVQDEVRVRLVEGDLADEYQREMEYHRNRFAQYTGDQ